MSEPVAPIVAVAVLLAALPSLVAPVVPDRVDDPVVVGVPETVQVILAPAATETGGVGAHVKLRPDGNPDTAQDALVAARAGEAALVQVNVPEYGTPTLAPIGNALKSMLMSEPDTATVCEAVLFKPLVSLVAPVVSVTVLLPVVVGVPLTGQEMLAPAASVAGGVGVHAPTVTPAGNPAGEQVAAMALAVALGLLVQRMVPAYGVPTVPVAGSADRSAIISAPVVVIDVDAVLFAGLPSLLAVVEPEIALVPTVVGVPDTVQVILAPVATLVGGAGTQLVVRPAGRPLTAHDADVAVSAGEAAFVHVNVPV